MTTMTIFFCVLAIIALISTPSAKGSTGIVVAVMVPWTMLVLGLATLAFLSGLQ